MNSKPTNKPTTIYKSITYILKLTKISKDSDIRNKDKHFIEHSTYNWTKIQFRIQIIWRRYQYYKIKTQCSTVQLLLLLYFRSKIQQQIALRGPHT